MLSLKEHEVDTKPGVVDTKPALATEERKIIAQLQKEVREVLDKGLPQSLAPGVFVLEVEEFENERVLDGLFWCHQISRFGVFRFPQHGGFVL